MNKWSYDDNTKFLNPYHFVSIDDPCKKDVVKPCDTALTGKIHCKLRTRSLFFIPNTTNKNAFNEQNCEHQTYDFFSYEDISGKNTTDEDISGKSMTDQPPVPVIPGSSLRGMLRSAYEAVTNSCLSTTRNTLLYARSPAIRKPGFLKYGEEGWALYSADVGTILVGRTKQVSYKDQTLTADGHTYHAGDNVSLDGGRNTGILVIGEANARKNKIRLFTRQDDNIAIIPDAQEQWEAQLTLYQDTGVNKNLENTVPLHFGYHLLSKKLDQTKEHPVWYLEVGSAGGKGDTRYYLAPAAISRDIFRSTLEGILMNQGNHAACKDTEHLCPACQLFGMVGTEGALSSRVRVRDAKLHKTGENGLFAGPMPLKILGKPHLSCSQFYLKRPARADAKYWNFDYVRFETTDYQLQEINAARLRGRKFYWHSPKADPSAPGVESKFNRTIRPVQADNIFEFDIYFDRISEEELKQLIWVLTLGQNDDTDTLCHKLGYGKPIGMGSVKITVESLHLRTLSMTKDEIVHKTEPVALNAYSDDPYKGQYPLYVAEFLKLSRLDVLQRAKLDESALTYPLGESCDENVENSTASYHWFVGSKQIYGTGIKPVFVSLPKLKTGKNDNSLPTLQKVIETRTQN